MLNERGDVPLPESPKYLVYDELVAFLKKAEKDYPDLVELGSPARATRAATFGSRH
jgi:hypothetical protein